MVERRSGAGFLLKAFQPIRVIGAVDAPQHFVNHRGSKALLNLETQTWIPERRDASVLMCFGNPSPRPTGL
ncbi:MAG: hypothetical protein M3X11_05760 [Acidobacteriota bacterium]|nr:hypothetical protein [Acidobacteriota bacterium]